MASTRLSRAEYTLASILIVGAVGFWASNWPFTAVLDVLTGVVFGSGALAALLVIRFDRGGFDGN